MPDRCSESRRRGTEKRSSGILSRSHGMSATDNRSIQRRGASRHGSGAVLSYLPAAARKIFLSNRDRLVLERRGHRVVPAVEESEQRYHAHDFDDLLFAPVIAQFGEHE